MQMESDMKSFMLEMSCGYGGKDRDAPFGRLVPYRDLFNATLSFGTWLLSRRKCSSDLENAPTRPQSNLVARPTEGQQLLQ